MASYYCCVTGRGLLFRMLIIGAFYLSSNATLGAQAGGPNVVNPNINTLPVRGLDPFDEVEQFERGSFIVHLGTAFVSDINLPAEDLLSNTLPGLQLLLEKAVADNIGVAVKFGTKWWNADKIGYNYRYHSLGLRGTYHFNLLDQLDPYLGINVTGRYFGIGNGDQNVNEINVTVGPTIGARYYFTDGLAAFGEFSEDGIGKIHLGITFKLK